MAGDALIDVLRQTDMRFVAMSALALAVLAVPAPAHAGQATCSNPGLPLGARASGDLLPGRLTLGMINGLISLGGTELVDDPQGPVRYDAGLVLVETRLTGEYALTPSLAIGFGLPFRVIDVGVTYLDPSTGEPVTSASEIHVRDETLAGIADPSVQVHLARELGGLRLHARAGVTLPLGRTEENPHLLGQIGQEHQHVQLGTGTVVPFALVEAQRAFGPVTGALWAQLYASLYENDHGFQPGHRIAGGLNASSALGTRTWSFALATEVYGETSERWDGIVYEDEGNAGRVDVMVGGSVAWRPVPQLAIVADVRVPVATSFVGQQLDYDLIAGLSVIGTYDVRARPSYAGADARPFGDPGTAPPLVPVAGKITVFDLWADWCAPCRDLDARLAVLANRYPDRLAIRKLDVVDTESLAWTTYLAPGSFELPHLKVYGADGALIFEASAPPEELIKRLEALLR